MTISHIRTLFFSKAAALFSAVALLLSGCSSPLYDNTKSSSPDLVTETEKSAAVTLAEWNQWTATPNNGLGMDLQRILGQFQKNHPEITVSDHALEGSTYKTKIETDFTGTAGDIDVFYYWAPGRIRPLVNTDAILPLSPYIPDETLHDILPGMTDNFDIDGNLYGLPMSSSVMVLFCNRDLFESCGLDLPGTWADLIACAPIFRQAGITPLTIGAADSWVAAGFFESLMTGLCGADAIRQLFQAGKYGGAGDDKSAGFTLDTIRKASGAIEDFRKAGLFPDDIANCTWGDALTQFEEGKAAMLFDGTWSVTELENSGFDLSDLQIILVPSEDGLAHDAVGGASDSFFVNSHTDHPREAAQLAIALSRGIGESAPSSGAGISAWHTALPSDDPGITRIYDSILGLLDEAKQVPAWNTMEGTSDFMARHQSFAQTLLSRGGTKEEIREIYG